MLPFSMLILLNKPFNVLSQFTDRDGRRTLAEFVKLPGVRAAGRLDYDSEGLLLLTDDGRLQARIAYPRHKLPKTYWVQIEVMPDAAALERLRRPACRSTTDAPARHRRTSSRNRQCGHATRRSASAKTFRPHGSNSLSLKAETARCDA